MKSKHRQDSGEKLANPECGFDKEVKKGLKRTRIYFDRMMKNKSKDDITIQITR
jgi:hypothetical protein